MQNNYYLLMDSVKQGNQKHLRIFLNQKSKYSPECVTGFVLNEDKVKQVEALDYKEDFGSEFMKRISQSNRGQIVFEYRDGEKHHIAEFSPDEFFPEFNKAKQEYAQLGQPKVEVKAPKEKLAPHFKTVVDCLRKEVGLRFIVINDILVHAFGTDDMPEDCTLHVFQMGCENHRYVMASQRVARNKVSGLRLIGRLDRNVVPVRRFVLITGEVVYSPINAVEFHRQFKITKGSINLFHVSKTQRTGRLSNLVTYTHDRPDVMNIVPLTQTNELTELINQSKAHP